MVGHSLPHFYRILRHMSYTGLLLLLLACLSSIICDGKIVGSFLLGVVLWMLPTLCFVKRVFSRIRVASSRHLLGIFYQAECLKLLLVGFLFVMIVRFIPVNYFMLLMGYLAVQFLFLILLMMKEVKDKKVYYEY